MEIGAETRSRRRRIRRIATVLAVLAALPVAAVAGFHFHAASRAEKALAAARSLGYPVTEEELAAWYDRRAASGDAEAVYGPAFASMKAWGPDRMEQLKLIPPPGQGAWPERDEKVSPEALAAISEFTRYNREALDRLHEAAAREPTHFPLVFPYSHHGGLAMAVSLLRLEALWHTEEGRPDEAARAIEAALAAARTIRDEPSTGTFPYAELTDGVVDSLERLLLHGAPVSPERLAALQRRLEQAENPDAFELDLIRQLSEVSGSQNGWFMRLDDFLPPPLHHRLARVAGAYAADALSGLAGRVYLSTGIVHLDEECCVQYLLGRLRQAANPGQPAAAPGPPPTVFVLSNYTMMTCADWHLDVAYRKVPLARLRMARAAVAVEGFRAERGELPGSLDALVADYLPAVPRDPFRDGPLCYRQYENGTYTVYSVGHNGSDDGGRSDGGGWWEMSDIAFPVRRPDPGEAPPPPAAAFQE